MVCFLGEHHNQGRLKKVSDGLAYYRHGNELLNIHTLLPAAETCSLSRGRGQQAKGLFTGIRKCSIFNCRIYKLCSVGFAHKPNCRTARHKMPAHRLFVYFVGFRGQISHYLHCLNPKQTGRLKLLYSDGLCHLKLPSNTIKPKPANAAEFRTPESG